MKLSDYIALHLADYGVRHVFMIPGGGAMHLNDSFGKQSRISYLCNHHEQASAIAAEGYFRASGRMAAVSVTSGPGGTNTITGVLGQWLDSIPCIYISGQVKRETTIASCPHLDLRQLGDQEINITDIVRPITKYAEMVRDPKSIRYHMDRALYLATHGRPGPVWLDIPLDIQASIIDEYELASYDSEEDKISFDEALIAQQVSGLLDRLAACERPVILAGHGIRLSGATEEFVDLVEHLGIPVTTTICGHDLIRSNHPLFLGRPGVCGDRLGNFVIQNSDFMLAIGARMGVRQVSYNYNSFARVAFRAMVDIDAAELKKPTLKLHMAIHSDAGYFIKEMLRQFSKRQIAQKKQWLAWCNNRKQDLPSVLEDNPATLGYVNPYVFTDTLFRSLSSGAIVVTGNGTAFTAILQAMFINEGVRVFANQGCASMGYGLPAAIGACIAREKEPVILITGDGSIQMNIQELQTVAAHNLPIKIFMLNNAGYLAIRATQDAYFDGRHVGSDKASGLHMPDTLKIAEAYGLKTCVLPDHDSLIRISDLISAPGPLFCEVMMDPAQTLYPKVSSSVSADGKLISRPLEDMYPFLDRDEFHAKMIVPSLEE